ncbi:cellulose biosynthesis protein BcsR [Budvicia aquatica]|uniref:Protein of uncharacterized function (DUF2629) n=1 Tax=Budvicia aquatica TaxID=82979 RepID=A0A2C6BV48_9GAMM|nr:cellulose biosynthesis protein BcsR [Budvicia aquatica]PHI28030.1 hypothetical protein CRN84_01055 [Budvicia aquatica]VFS45789.1 Protein of uncharacterised function (DUF2629) [Budvicia aquatica]
MNDEVKSFHSEIAQGRETTENTFKPQSALSEFQDDISAVALAYNLPTLRYIDLSRQSALSQAFSRWPLLSELNQRQVIK